MKTNLIVRIKTKDQAKLLLKLNKIDVNISSISYEKDYLIFKIDEDDLKRLQKYLISEKIYYLLLVLFLV